MQGNGSSADYTLLEQIGEGTYGKVYKAMDKKTKKTVAIKVIALEQEWLPLLAEVNMVIDLSHPSIVNYYAWFFEGGCLWLVMECCDGGGLSDLMRVLKRPFDENELAAICRGVLQSLQYVHSLNRIHRDIKAANVLVTSEGLVKLCDFGVSAQLDSSVGAKTSTRIGSPYWMAPEVILAQGHNTKADIWSFGITALELFTGRPPRSEIPGSAVLLKIPMSPPPEAPANASERFKKFIARCLVRDPELRASAAELLEDEFIASVPERAAGTIVRSLVTKFIQERAAAKAGEGQEEGEEEEEEDAGEDDFAQSLLDGGASTLLLGSDTGTFMAGGGGTFVAGQGTMLVQGDSTMVASDGTMVVQGGGGGLGDVKLTFIDNPPPKIAQAQKRNFSHFSDRDLRVLLQSIKTVAQNAIAGGAAPGGVLANYEDVRKGVVKELQRRHPETPDDYEELKV
jgi:hypothetical protein